MQYTLICSLYVGSTLSAPDQYEAWLQVVESMITGEKKSVEEDDLTLIAMLPFANLSGHLYQEMRDYLKKMVGDPLLPLLNISCHQQKPLRDLFKEATTDPPDLANDGSEKYAKVSVNLGVTAVMLNNNSIRIITWSWKRYFKSHWGSMSGIYTLYISFKSFRIFTKGLTKCEKVGIGRLHT